MGWVSADLDRCIDAAKWNVFDIPNPYVPSRPGVAVLAWNRGDGDSNVVIYVGGLTASRQASRANYNGTINSFVPAGVEVSFGMTESSLVHWKFMEM